MSDTNNINVKEKYYVPSEAYKRYVHCYYTTQRKEPLAIAYNQLVLVSYEDEPITHDDLLKQWKQIATNIKKDFPEKDTYGTVALFDQIVSILEEKGMQPLLDAGVFSVYTLEQ